MAVTPSLDAIKNAIQVDLETNALPGLPAHQHMAPLHREVAFPTEEVLANARRAAVLCCLLVRNGKIKLLYIRRNVYPGAHSGQIAFPGGGFESQDVDLQATALREAEEETALDPDATELIAPLTPIFVPPSNYFVQPYLAIHRQFDPELKPDPSEVQALIEIGLEHLLDDRCESVRDIDMSYGTLKNVPVYEVPGTFIWGASAIITSELLALYRRAMK